MNNFTSKLFDLSSKRSYGYKPTDYYYKYNKNGKKMYYSKIVNRVVAKNEIPKEFIALIKENRTITNESLLELEKQREQYTTQLNEMRDKIEQIDAKIKLMKETGKWKSESPSKLQEQWKEDDIKRKEEHEKEAKIKFEEFMNRFRSYERKQQQSKNEKEKPTSSSSSSSSSKSEDYNALLSKHSITDKKALKMWLLKNHPDKGGDEQLCMEVMQAARFKGWIK